MDTPGPMGEVARRTTADGVAPRLSPLAHRAGLLPAQPVVLLGDDAQWIWRFAEEPFPEAGQMVEASHARELVWDVARAAFVEEPTLRDAWARVLIEKRREGQREAVRAASERFPPLAPAPGTTRRLPAIEAESLRRQLPRMPSPPFSGARDASGKWDRGSSWQNGRLDSHQTFWPALDS